VGFFLMILVMKPKDDQFAYGAAAVFAGLFGTLFIIFPFFWRGTPLGVAFAFGALFIGFLVTFFSPLFVLRAHGYRLVWGKG
jgi:hypothetical protein